MKNLFLGLMLLSAYSVSAQSTQQHPPEGILVRVNEKTGERIVVNATLEESNPSETAVQAVAEELISKNEAITVKEGSELDDDSSTDSWWWYWNYNNYYYNYNYYGWNYNYFPVYSWNYNYYNYCYYRWW
ncbi:MAG: hypothetical protein KA715_13450 [Xanthomonadaceae bacterium]|nr:hypothetical protein [Xanthomonadaceae bacterium]